MKILVLANNAAGLYRFRKDLMRELMAQGHEIVISIPNGNNVEDLKAMGCQYIETNVDRRGINPVKDLKLFRTYRKLLRSVKPDLVITYTVKPNIYGGVAARMAKKPYAVNITGLGTAFEKGGMLRKLVVAMYKVACRKAKVVFFENTGNKELFVKEKIAKEAQTCVLNGAGVNLEDFPCQEYPTEAQPTRFLFIGRVMREKGVDELLAAMKALRQEGQDCTLDMLGGYEENYLETIEQCEKEGWLKFHGFQKDIKPFVAACHCAILPSWHEGMANTNLESASMGRPLITSNIYGCKEAVVENESGYLAEAKNWQSLYEAMKRFIELPLEQRRAMGEVGRKHMETNFDKKVVVAKTMEQMF